MAKRKTKKVRLTASVTAQQKAALEDIAERNDVSLARVIHEAIKEFLGRHRDRRLPLFERPAAKE
jgi:hypothetical protein